MLILIKQMLFDMLAAELWAEMRLSEVRFSRRTGQEVVQREGISGWRVIGRECRPQHGP